MAIRPRQVYFQAVLKQQWMVMAIVETKWSPECKGVCVHTK